MNVVDQDQMAFKAVADPHNLMNPGKSSQQEADVVLGKKNISPSPAGHDEIWNDTRALRRIVRVNSFQRPEI